MIRVPITERPDWREQATAIGFKFHTMHGEPYWDERAYYQFTLKQIEQDIEAPSSELHQMLIHMVDKICDDDELMRRFAIPEPFWQMIRRSWLRRDPHLYGRFDLCYDGTHSAKLLEANYDTPTSLFETSYWQWIWLEQQVNAGLLPRQSDQFNSLQEQLITRFRYLHKLNRTKNLYLSCCQGSEEDKGTIDYLKSCAIEAGVRSQFLYIEEIGIDDYGHFTDLEDRTIDWCFKLYPWEFMFEDEYASALLKCGTTWLEPSWKALLSNKAILPLLWQHFPNHPNLLPAFFADQRHRLSSKQGVVKKPIFSREGANIEIRKSGQVIAHSSGCYGDEGYIYQAYHPLPKFADEHIVVGSWIIGDEPAGMGLRADKSLITQDLSRFVPHIILA
ncbi:glutathionylspermidine synthase family protein [Pseudoalteromonas sp. SMS1]|uniref:glutathionylspermidine synthase family protein n=1 Tax=Pseudoalteromonas sp. SMS1 TaxID=2908894 RepID=UPI001F4326B5|nr:glutathionylspermidine synthase family protein [Pseudoalteromonas sp. SMS1]MCF2856495.1 glutathionylspermidine synthase family protein [Pseudoalteromonas sp. SMS1]